ncbi:hypothetical protein DFR26_1557 [Paraperlucidibaca baekdonensis]|uniref:Lysozyme inhibitor LprI N-terminal domain-containing protein n=1 Tax=Paraperlucidibaca baekdonensis TaxID=748120 RepID=A0A3E0H4L8_9GAMM|nr:lysozyme inhibitor LprI family protein [Paraperlucidibaca baekdonensis]REH37774.1 hypothetical protein DFR26_1557 [Paraperlucidibaca baekdonensis]
MPWLTALLAPMLAFAAVMSLFQAGSTGHALTPEPAVEQQHETLAEQAGTEPDDTQSTKGLLSDWRPDIDQTIDQLERWLSQEQTQQELNYSMVNLAALYDTKLYLVFIDYLATVDAQQSATILQEQQAWLQLRKERTAAARLAFAEGSLASYNASEAYVYITHERIDSITALMQQNAP